MRNTFSILFYTKNSRIKNKLAPIYMRITVCGERREIFTEKWVELKHWSGKGFVKGNRKNSKEINQYLNNLVKRVLNFRAELLEHNQIVTADKLKSMIIPNKENYAKKRHLEYLLKKKEALINKINVLDNKIAALELSN